jgi:hypothetical protein
MLGKEGLERMSGEGREEAGPKPGLGPASKCLGLGIT